MSTTSEAAEAETVADERCASCGTAGGNDIKLKNCTACYLVKYCGVECQRNHRAEHKRECKRRAAELKDELLFKQPESTHLGDCPICLLPILPIDTPQSKTRLCTYHCCSNVVCNGCVRANNLREIEARLSPTCPFCRHSLPRTDEEIFQLGMKRVEANDPFALCNVGTDHFERGDFTTAFKFWKKAAGLGNIQAHYLLSNVYDNGEGVEQNMRKYEYHLEQAAIGGHVLARHNLAALEDERCNIERATKHLVIAANLGCDPSIKALKKYYSRGVISKEDFDSALRAYQVALGASKSPQRDAAEALMAE